MSNNFLGIILAFLQKLAEEEIAMMEKNRKVLQDPAQRLKTNMLGLSPIISDPLGSYTGRPLDPEEMPVQDADDL